MTKKVISVFLIIMLIVSTCCTPVIATNSYDQDYNGEIATDVVYQANQTSEYYTITVPAQLNPGDSGYVTVAGAWRSDKTLSVTADQAVVLKSNISNETKSLSVNFDGIRLSGSNTSEVSQSKQVSVATWNDSSIETTQPLFGQWSGVFNYNVNLKTNSTSTRETVYYMQPYNATANGATYTVVFFNETQARIYENGLSISGLTYLPYAIEDDVITISAGTQSYTAQLSDDKTTLSTAQFGNLQANVTPGKFVYGGHYDYSFKNQGDPDYEKMSVVINADGSYSAIVEDSQHTEQLELDGIVTVVDNKLIITENGTSSTLAYISIDGSQMIAEDRILTLQKGIYDDEFPLEWNSTKVINGYNEKQGIYYKISNLTPDHDAMLNSSVEITINNQTTTYNVVSVDNEENLIYTYAYDTEPNGGAMDDYKLLIAVVQQTIEIPNEQVTISEGVYALLGDNVQGNTDYKLMASYTPPDPIAQPVGLYIGYNEEVLDNPNDLTSSAGTYPETYMTTIYIKDNLSWDRYTDGAFAESGVASYNSRTGEFKLNGQLGLVGYVENDQIVITGDEIWLGFGGYTTLQKMNPENITSLQSAITKHNKHLIGYTSGMTEITIPQSFVGEDGLMYDVKKIGTNAFSGEAELKKVILPNTVTSVGNGAFYHCESLTDINFPENLTTIYEHAFIGAGFTEIAIPSTVKYLRTGAFSYCVELINVSVNAENLGIDVFTNCLNLTNITIGRDVKNLDDVLCYVPNLTSITAPNGNLNYTIVDNCIIDPITKELVKGCNNSTIPSDGSVTTIANKAFAYNNKMESIEIPSTITTIGRDAFAYCPSLTNITIPGSIQTVAEFSFYKCEKLTNVTISDGVKTIGYQAFSYTPIEEIVIPASVTLIKAHAFIDCQNLIDVSFVDTTTWYTQYSDGVISTQIVTNNPANNAKYLTQEYGYYNLDWVKK